MWIATDSSDLYPILIEIETPHKRWFYGDRADPQRLHACPGATRAEWQAQFSNGNNRSAFLDYYEIPHPLLRRRLTPRYVLIYARADDWQGTD